MTLLEKFNKTTSPIITIGFPAFNATEEEVKNLLSTINYVVKSFNERNTTPIEAGIMSSDDICPRSIYWGD